MALIQSMYYIALFIFNHLQFEFFPHLDFPRFSVVHVDIILFCRFRINPYPTVFPYGNGMVLHFYQQQESSTTKTVHKVINRGLKTYV